MYWSITFDDLYVDIQFYDFQNPIRVPTPVLKKMSQRSRSSDLVDGYVKMSILSRRIKICNHILTFFGGSYLNYFRCIQQAVCQIFCFYHQTLHFPWNLTQISSTTSYHALTLTQMCQQWGASIWAHIMSTKGQTVVLYYKIWTFLNTMFKKFWKNLFSFILYWISKCVNTFMGIPVLYTWQWLYVFIHSLLWFYWCAYLIS